jgi:hypothetical protein
MSAVSLTPQPESLGQFADDIGELRTAIVDLQANFADVGAQGREPTRISWSLTIPRLIVRQQQRTRCLL